MPYDPKGPLVEQVRKSLAVSLENLKPSDSGDEQPYLDALVLHSPMRDIDETMDVWHTLESFVPNQVRNLGISNCNLFTLMDLYERANVKPAVVQNRFYPGTKFDIGLRRFCQEHAIVYQTFWTLSANPNLVRSTEAHQLASQLRISSEAAFYALVLGLENTVILNGTKNIKHMKEDWQALSKVKDYAISNPEAWKSTMMKFKRLIGQPGNT